MARQPTYTQRHRHLSTPYPTQSSIDRSRHTHGNTNNQTLTIPQLLHPSPLPATPQQPQLAPSTHGSQDIAFSPGNITLLDEYGQDPKFLELQQELRCLLFTGARSRRGSTSYGDEGSSSSYRQDEEDANSRRRGQNNESTSPQLMKQIITSGKMAGYLKNYMAEVAPWVSSPHTRTYTLFTVLQTY